jgi:hypothetical protein
LQRISALVTFVTLKLPLIRSPSSGAPHEACAISDRICNTKANRTRRVFIIFSNGGAYNQVDAGDFYSSNKSYL